MNKITLKLITILFVILNVTSVSSQCWKEIETGYTTSIALKYDGTLWVWGAGSNKPTQLGTDTNWKTISRGTAHGTQITNQNLAIKTDGTLWAWGFNSYGQCGIGTFNSEVFNPTQIGTATNWESVSSGKYHSMAIKTDGTLWAWGRNHKGQLGIGNTTDQNMPVQVGTSTNWKSVSANNDFTHAIKTDGTIWSWGSNNYERLGLNLGPNSFNFIKTSPTQVGTDSNWKFVTSGNCFGYHSSAIKTDGTLWSWGLNDFGQLGDGTTTIRSIPTQIGTETNWNFVTSGENYTLAIKTDGTMWGWGRNDGGKLGDGTTTDKLIPTQIGSNNTWKKISSEVHTLALRTDDNLWVWGSNTNGQLGTGNNLNQLTPVAVTCVTSTLGISEANVTNIAIYPNPTTGIIAISNQNNLPIEKIEIFDTLGNLINTKKGNISQIDISTLNKGIYIFKIYSAENVSIKKIIKQ